VQINRSKRAEYPRHSHLQFLTLPIRCGSGKMKAKVAAAVSC
jgi:hypothetical protein